MKDKNIMLILCGSLVSMMYESTLSYLSPLYGKRTEQIKIQPIPFKYYEEFFNSNIDKTELIKYYFVTGGVPKYIEKELKETKSYFSILKTISFGNRKLFSIVVKSRIKQQSLSYYLKVLSDMDIVKREVPIAKKDPQKSNKGLYFIKDYFLDFWLKFACQNLSLFEIGEKKHVNFVYENLCRKK